MPVKLTMEEVINRCVNNGLDLPLIGENYINSNTKIKFQCQNDPDHIYERVSGNHWLGINCPICSNKHKQRNTIKTIEEYYNECLDNDIDLPILNQTYKGNKKKLTHICELNHKYDQTPNNHLNNHGCPICNKSKGELIIFDYLTKTKHKFVREKKFNKCRGKNNNYLRFDFYLPEYNLCIEFDGQQHFKPWRFKDKNKAIKKLKETQKNDELKNKFCNSNKINLLRIPYWEKENIEYLIEEKLKNLKKKGR